MEWNECDLKYRYKAEAYCSAVERCVADVEAKLLQWGVAPDVAENIIGYLQNEKFVDQKRFCSAFVRDKYRFNQWGRVKIGQALRLKKIPAELIAVGMEEIDEQEYMAILAGLIGKKKKSVKARSEYERNSKLIHYAVGRGFEMEAVCRCLRQNGVEDVCLD